jgi:hypothetical protein
MLRKIFYSIVRKIDQKRRGEACIFEKWFTKKLGVNNFPNFNKDFSINRNYFLFDHHFIVK